MQLIEIENKIKSMVAEDVTNPDIYNQIYKLVYYFFKRRHLVTDYKMAEEVAHLAAEELYLKVYNGGEIYSWIGYINRSYQAYIRLWRSLNGSEIIDVSTDDALRESIVSMCVSDPFSNATVETINLDYIDNLPDIIDKIMKNSKYYEFTKEYTNARLSIMLSLLNGKFTSYNLNESDKMYTNMIYTMMKDKLISELGISDSSSMSSFSLMQLYSMSNADIEE